MWDQHLTNFERFTSLPCGTPFHLPHMLRPSSAWWLQMSWPSTAVMLTGLWPVVTNDIWNLLRHDDVIKRKHFLRYWPFVWGIHRSPVNSPHKGQWRGALMFSLICAWINGWVNNGEAGDLRRHRTHYDVTVMQYGYRVTSTKYTRDWSGDRQPVDLFVNSIPDSSSQSDNAQYITQRNWQVIRMTVLIVTG